MICRACDGKGIRFAGFAARLCEDCYASGTIHGPVTPALPDEPSLWRALGEQIAGQVQALGLVVLWMFGSSVLAVVKSPEPTRPKYQPVIEPVGHAEIEALYRVEGGES